MKYRRLIILSLVVLLMACMAIPASAGDGVQLSLEDAIKKSLDTSKELAAYQKGIEIKDLEMDEAMTGVYYTPIDRGYNAGDKATFSNYYSKDYNLKKAKKELENEKNQLVIDTKQAYFDVLSYNKQLNVKEKNVEVDKLKLSQVKAKYAVGMASNSDIKAAETTLATDSASLEDIKVKLDKAYAQLNTYVGLEQSSRPVLTSEIEADFKPIDDVERVAGIAADGSFDVWTAAEAAKLASVTKIFQTWVDVGEYSEEKANLTAASTKETIEIELRNMCNNINYLLQKKNELEVQKEELSEKYRIAKLKYDLGMITRDEVDSLEASLLLADSGIFDITEKYVIATDTMDKYMGKLKY